MNRSSILLIVLASVFVSFCAGAAGGALAGFYVARIGVGPRFFMPQAQMRPAPNPPPGAFPQNRPNPGGPPFNRPNPGQPAPNQPPGAPPDAQPRNRPNPGQPPFNPPNPGQPAPNQPPAPPPDAQPRNHANPNPPPFNPPNQPPNPRAPFFPPTNRAPVNPAPRDDFAANAPNIVVTEVIADSPAAKAGLLVGDVIVSVDGRPARGFAEVMDRKKPGDAIELQIQRGGESRQIKVTLGAQPNRASDAYLGIRFAPARLPAPRPTG